VVPQRGEDDLCHEGSRVGTLYGVYDYLHRLGFRFFGMGDKGTVRPTEACTLVQKLDVVENPPS